MAAEVSIDGGFLFAMVVGVAVFEFLRARFVRYLVNRRKQ